MICRRRERSFELFPTLFGPCPRPPGLMNSADPRPWTASSCRQILLKLLYARQPCGWKAQSSDVPSQFHNVSHSPSLLSTSFLESFRPDITEEIIRNAHTNTQIPVPMCFAYFWQEGNSAHIAYIEHEQRCAQLLVAVWIVSICCNLSNLCENYWNLPKGLHCATYCNVKVRFASRPRR